MPNVWPDVTACGDWNSSDDSPEDSWKVTEVVMGSGTSSEIEAAGDACGFDKRSSQLLDTKSVGWSVVIASPCLT